MSQLTTRDYKGAGRHAGPPPSGGLKEFLFGALAGALLAGLGTALVMHHGRRSAAAACATTAGAAHAPATVPSAQNSAAHGSSRKAPVRSASAPVHRESAGAGAPDRHAGATTQRNDHQDARAPREVRPASKSRQPGTSVPAHTRYDFYQMLPNLKVTVPPPTAPGTRSVGPNGRTRFAGYVLQVGAYRDEGQARHVVAYLDSLGILAHIDTAHDGRTALYRVRIGPIIERAELDRFQGVLKRIGLPGVLIPGATR